MTNTKKPQQVEVRIDQLSVQARQKLKRLQRMTGLSEAEAMTAAATRGIDSSFVLAAFRPPEPPKRLH